MKKQNHSTLCVCYQRCGRRNLIRQFDHFRVFARTIRPKGRLEESGNEPSERLDS